MQYPLLKLLQQNNLPDTVEGSLLVVLLAGGDVDTVFEPTFEGLVEACGEAFTEIRDLQNLQKRAVHKIEVPPEKRYEAVSTNQKKLYYGHGHDMKEAMANLFLALHNPIFGL